MFTKPVIFALSAALLFVANPVFSEQKDSYQVAAISAGDLKEAEQVLKAILATNPEDPYALLNLAAVYQQGGQQDKGRAQDEVPAQVPFPVVLIVDRSSPSSNARV